MWWGCLSNYAQVTLLRTAEVWHALEGKHRQTEETLEQRNYTSHKILATAKLRAARNYWNAAQDLQSPLLASAAVLLVLLKATSLWKASTYHRITILS